MRLLQERCLATYKPKVALVACPPTYVIAMVFAHQALECPMEGTHHIIPVLAPIALGPTTLTVPPFVIINLAVSSAIPLVNLSIFAQDAVPMTNGP